jgi:hypothetical protein
MATASEVFVFVVSAGLGCDLERFFGGGEEARKMLDAFSVLVLRTTACMSLFVLDLAFLGGSPFNNDSERVSCCPISWYLAWSGGALASAVSASIASGEKSTIASVVPEIPQLAPSRLPHHIELCFSDVVEGCEVLRNADVDENALREQAGPRSIGEVGSRRIRSKE